MTEQFKADGSIQKLVANKWKTVGIGQLSLIKNKHNPSQVLLKLVRNKRNEIHIFQCKPKVKTNGNSLILKGTDTKKKMEFVLAVRFNVSSAMQQFQDIFDQLYRRNQSVSPSKAQHARKLSNPPQAIKKQLSQYAWDCDLCHSRNEPFLFECDICKYPRPLESQKPKRIHIITESIQIDTLPELDTPTNNTPPSNEIKGMNPNTILSVVTEHTEETDEKQKQLQDKNEKKSSIKELITLIIHGEEVSSIKSQTVEDILLLCHDTFTDSETMLTTLLNTLCDRNLVDSTARIRGVKMCETWMKQYWADDFMDHNETLEIMYAFIDDLEDTDLSESDIKFLNRIKKTFEEKVTSVEVTKTASLISERVSAKFFGNIDIPKNYDVMKCTKQHIAEQITLMDFEIFKQIEKREMTGQSWKKKDREERAPHVLQMIKQFNCISKWVQCVVLQQKNKRRRTRCIETFIRIAICLKELRNFSACCAINFGLSANVLYRLKDAWAAVSRQDLKQYNEINTIYKGKKNWELLRVLHKNAHAPSILHTGLFLQDLLNTDEGNEDKKKDGTVNFSKLKRTYVLIEQICMYQQSQYFNIKTDDVLQHHLKSVWKKQATYDDNKMYKISSIVKSKDGENKDIDESEEQEMAW